MIRNITFLFLFCCSYEGYTQVATSLVQYDYQPSSNEHVTGSMYGHTGNHFFVCGNIESPPAFTGGTPGNTHSFVSRIDTAGNIIWTIIDSNQGNSNFYIQSMALDLNDNVYITGYYNGYLFLGGQALSNFASPGAACFTCKIDITGQVLWLRSGTTTTGNAWRGTDITVDAGGNIYVLGDFLNTVTIGSYNFTAANGSRNNFIAKYTPSGNLIWAKNYQGPFTAISGAGFSQIAAGQGPNNRIYMGGVYQGNVMLGTTNLISYNGTARNVMLAKLDTSGNFLSAISLGGSGNDDLSELSVSTGNKLSVTGTFLNSIAINGTTYAGSVYQRLYTAVLDTALGYSWSSVWGSATGNTIAYSTTMDNTGNCFITGEMQGSMTIGGTVLNLTGYSNAFLIKYDPSGTPVFVANTATSMTGATPSPFASGQSLCISADAKNFYETGVFEQEIHVPGSFINSIGSTVQDKADMFLLKYTILPNCTDTPNAATIHYSGGIFCPGTNVILGAIGQSAGTGMYYYWQSRPLGSSGPFITIPGATNTSLSVTTTISTEYRFVDSCSFNGLKNYGTQALIVKQLPAINSISETHNGNTYIFSATSPLTSTDTHVWEFGDGNSITGPANLNRTHTYTSPGSYTVKLLAFSNCGVCKDSLIIHVGNLDVPSLAVKIKGISIYPNPAIERITVQTDNTILLERINLINMEGRNISRQEVACGNIQTIAVQSLPAGYYMLKLTTDQGILNYPVQVQH